MKRIPLILVLSALIFLVTFGAALLLSPFNAQPEIKLQLSAYTVKPLVVQGIDIDIINLEHYPVSYRVIVLDALTRDIANNDGVISYDPIHGTVNSGGKAKARVLIHPTQQHRHYLVRAYDASGKFITQKQLTVIAYE